jgi:hypothetical protein
VYLVLVVPSGLVHVVSRVLLTPRPFKKRPSRTILFRLDLRLFPLPLHGRHVPPLIVEPLE